MFFINEISPATDPEWVELYSPEISSLQNCSLYLHDSEDTKQKVTFTEDIKVENHYFVIEKGQYGWSSNWLNNGGDTVSIKCESQVDSHTYSDSKGKSIGRSPDGNGNFVIQTEPSRGTANFTPPPAIPSTPAVTSQPATPLPTTPTPSAAPVQELQKDEVTPIKTKSQVLAAAKETEATTISASPDESDEESTDNVNTVSYLLIIGGVVLLSVGAYPIIKKLYNEKHILDEKIP